MKKTALLIQYPSISHINGGFVIADMLRNKGYDVYYFIDSTMASHVKLKGFNHYPAFSNPIVQRYDEETLKKEGISYTYTDRLRDNFLSVFVDHRKNELYEAIGKLSPEIIIADTFAGSDFVLIYPLLKAMGIRFFYLETMLSSTADNAMPYLDSKCFPNETFKIAIEHAMRRSRRRLERLWMKLIYFGNDNVSFINDQINTHKLPNIYRLNERNYMDLTFTGITTIVMAPLELEFFAVKQYPQQNYLGFQLNKDSATPEVVDPRLETILKSGKEIIYISFGTVFGDKMYPEISKFMKILNNVLAGYLDVAVVFSLGKISWSSQDLNSLTNIEVFTFVPQTYLLKFCKLFITHGGLNSLKESIEAEVPMLAYPLDIDQIGNARKIQHKNFGLMGNIDHDSYKIIKGKIDLLISNHLTFKTSLQIFKADLEQKYDVESMLDSIISSEGLIL